MRIAVLVVAAACGSGSATPPPDLRRDAGDPSVREGATLYKVMCTPCHGADAKGYQADHAPSLVNPTFLESASDDFLRRSIALGRPGTSMAAYGKAAGGPLDADHVARVVAWLRARGPAAKPLPAVTPGDAARGAPIYVAKCQTCHGTATTRGEGVHLANSTFITLATDSFIRWAIVHGRPGTKMEPWQGKLSDRDIDDVVAFVRSLDRMRPIDAGQLPAPTGKEPLVVNPTGKDPKLDVRADPCPPNTACTPDPRYVSADQVKRALDDKRKLVIIDARPASEWMRVHITGAVSIPYLDLKRLGEIPNDGTWIVAYCACPHHLSGIVVDELRKRGHKHAVVLDEGILEWQRRDYPVVAAPGVTAPPRELPVAPAKLPGGP